MYWLIRICFMKLWMVCFMICLKIQSCNESISGFGMMLQVPWQCICKLSGFTHCECFERKCYLLFAGSLLWASGLFILAVGWLVVVCISIQWEFWYVYDWQALFYNTQTQLLSRPDVVEKIVMLGTATLGNSYRHVLKSGFNNTISDRATRVSFKVTLYTW